MTPPEDPQSPDPQIPQGGAAALPSYRDFAFRFTGQTGEYFRIWIVNLMLTLVTLGIYTPWAKVRSRRYFHAHTLLDGHAFDYLARPINILWGYLIVVALLVGYNVAGIFNPMFTVPFIALYFLAGPWVVYKAMRFKARNTSYRNVRFEFHGTLGEAYAVFLGMALLVPLTLGLIFPYWMMKQKEYFYKNIRFGGKAFQFTPDMGEYYTRYILASVMYLGITVVFTLLGSAVAASMLAAGAGPASGGGGTGEVWGPAILVGSYLPILAAFVFVQTYVYVCLFNYNLSRMLVERTQFDGKLKVGRFFWITLSNIVAIVASLGLLAPWAKVRRARYLAESVALSHPGEDLGDFAAGAGSEVSAVGDAAADVFEFEIGW